MPKGPSIKDVRNQGGLSSADKGWGGSSDADVRTIRYKKLPIFQNLWCVCTDKGGEGWATADKGGRGQFFSILWNAFYGRPLKIWAVRKIVTNTHYRFVTTSYKYLEPSHWIWKIYCKYRYNRQTKWNICLLPIVYNAKVVCLQINRTILLSTVCWFWLFEHFVLWMLKKGLSITDVCTQGGCLVRTRGGGFL